MNTVQQLQPLVDQNLWSATWFRPEAMLTAGAMILFVIDLFWRKNPRRVAYLTVGALAVLAATAGFLAAQPPDAQSLFNGMLANDAFASFFKWLFLGAAALVVIITAPGKDFPSPRIGEFYALLVAIVLGMFMMASATDLLMMYLSIELVSMVSYVLAGFKKGDRKAAEGSLKYVIYGGVASGVMLFGMSYLYGLTGTTNLFRIATQIQHISYSGTAEVVASKIALVVSATFVAAGLGYKIAAVPFHMWCPDVYEGAPTPFTAFLSVGPKAAGFALALRFFLSAFSTPAGANGLALPIGNIPWPAVIGVVAAITMTLGNLTALVQTNLKRLLAYSSIAHAGYTLMGLAAVSNSGTQSVMIYMAIYLVMNLGAFLVVILVADGTGSESILDYKGLAKRHPFAAVTFAIFLFSLTGLPPFAGFIGKWYLFVAVWERTSGPDGVWYGWLLLIGALNTAVSLYYYVRVIRAMFIDAPYAPDAKTFRSPLSWQVVLGGCAAAVLFFGVRPQLIIDWTTASLQLFRG
ncbi:NADH-quinone oxidoreductase subunit N [Anaeromyxobacter oryzae]|uniref:NADH-quinone oxidoreductase subunit N n=1 Tax=Anaeromyxobacter oryzae TaxID=2918170 RepID=A0ABM7WQX4_9BACT|nr:NADH-quinone oxidoreductase subunit N [Anaeromyxobacter oryzae]BDG01863.1 NADH-quinone oxidoreductase subunit N [Anaeromyxobacter oryzae]